MSNLEDAIRAFPIITWLSNYTQVYDRGGRNVYADCPICDGKKTLGVEREKKLVHCFRCNEGGHGGDIWNGKAHAVRFISIVERCSWHEAIQTLYKFSGLPDPPRVQKQTPLQLLPKEALSLADVPDTDPAVAYLKRRGVQHLQKNSYVCLSGEYRGRILLPAFFLDQMVGFEAKSYTGQKPPSLFPDWMDTYSYFYTTKLDFSSGILIITESILDAETVGRNAIGCYGGFKDGHITPLLQFRKRGIDSIMWFLDGDAWKKQKKNILTKTLGMFKNFVVNVPKDADPNSLGRSECWKLLSSAIQITDEMDLLKAEILFGKF